MGDLLKFPPGKSLLFTWAKGYLHKYTREGPTTANVYLKMNAPSQLHGQIVKLAGGALRKMKAKEKDKSEE